MTARSPGRDRRRRRPTGAPSWRAGSSAIPRSTTSPGSTAAPPPVELAAHRLHRGGHPQRRDLAPAPGDRGRHGRPLRGPLVPGARPPGARPARDQRDRDAAAARRLRANRPAADGDRARLGRDLRHARRRCRPSTPRTSPRPSRCAPAFQRDISELEEYFAQLRPPAPAACPAACCAFSPRSGPGSTARWSAISSCRSSRCSSATTRACSSSTPTTRRARSRPRSRTRFGAPSTSRPTGSISLSRALRLLRRPSLPVPAPAFEPLMARLGARLGAGGLVGDGVRLLRLRPRGRQHAAARRDRLRAALRALPARSATSRGRPRARSVGPGLHPGGLARPARGAGPMSAAAPPPPGRRRSPTSCGASGSGSRTGWTRSPPPSAPRRSLPVRLRSAIELVAPPPRRRLPRGRVGIRRGLRRGGVPRSSASCTSRGGGCRRPGSATFPPTVAA